MSASPVFAFVSSILQGELDNVLQIIKKHDVSISLDVYIDALSYAIKHPDIFSPEILLVIYKTGNNIVENIIYMSAKKHLEPVLVFLIKNCKNEEPYLTYLRTAKGMVHEFPRTVELFSNNNVF